MIDREPLKRQARSGRVPRSRLSVASPARSGRRTLASCAEPTHHRRSGARIRGIPVRLSTRPFAQALQSDGGTMRGAILRCYSARPGEYDQIYAKAEACRAEPIMP
jgi:hypothetical protein